MTIDERMEEWALAFSGPKGEAAVKYRCSYDFCYFVNAFCDTFNPQIKVGEKDLPFLLYPRQEECLRFIHHCYERDLDAAYEKTRKVGMSWLHIAYRVWRWLYTPGYRAHFGSRVKELVEQTGNPDALFWKFDYIVRRLPPFLQPKGYSEDGEFRTLLRAENPENGAVITGEAMTANFGAGGRAGDAILDELSKCDNAEKAWDTVTQTASSKHAIATPNGQEFFWGLVHPDEYRAKTGKKTSPTPLVFRIHWKDMPPFNKYLVFPVTFHMPDQFESPQMFDKFMVENSHKAIGEGWGYFPGEEIPDNRGYHDDKGNFLAQYRSHEEPIWGADVTYFYPWRIREGARYDEVGAAKDLDINYEGSKAGRVYAVQFALAKKKFGVKRNDKFPLYIGLDPGHGDTFSLLWAQWNWLTLRYEFLKEYNNNGRSTYFYVPLMTMNKEHLPLMEEERATDRDVEFFSDMMEDEQSWVPDLVMLDPSTINKTANSKETVISILRAHDIPCKTNWEWTSFSKRIGALQRVLKRSILSKEGVPFFITSVSSVAWPVLGEYNKNLRSPSGYIHHPQFSHPVAAAEYLCCGDPHYYDAPSSGEADGLELDDLNNRYPKTLRDIYGFDPEEQDFGTESRGGW